MVGAPGSRAGEEHGWGLAVVRCGWRWGPAHYLQWWWLAEPPWPSQGLRTGEVGLRADLQLAGGALHPYRDCSPHHAVGRTGAQGPTPVCRQGLSRGQVQEPWPLQGGLGPGGPWAATPGWDLSRYKEEQYLRDSGVLGPQNWGRGWEESGVG